MSQSHLCCHYTIAQSGRASNARGAGLQAGRKADGWGQPSLPGVDEAVAGHFGGLGDAKQGEEGGGDVGEDAVFAAVLGGVGGDVDEVDEIRGVRGIGGAIGDCAFARSCRGRR